MISSLLKNSIASLASGGPLRAAHEIQFAARLSWGRHPGFFRSAEAENLLASISRTSVRARRTRRSSPNGSLRILHVATHLAVPGGHTSAILKWIEADTANRHSVAVTQQLDPVDDEVAKAVRTSGGSVRLLDRFAGIFRIAGRLRDLAAGFDVVVLSTDPSDVVPILAFAGDDDRPPIALFNHADHVFWLGERITDLLVGFRESGNLVARARRGFQEDRIALLPLPLRPVKRSDLPKKAEARRALGLPEEGLFALTVASPYKIRPTPRADYFALHAPVFDALPSFGMLLVGPEPGALDLSGLAPAVRGRIHAFGIQRDLSLFQAAADVYVDSTPFASQTSLLESASLGLPCLSWRPYPRGCPSAVLGSDDPAYTGFDIVHTDPEAYRAALTGLLADRETRETTGAALGEAVSCIHWGAGWQATLDTVYARVAENARCRPHPVSPDEGPSKIDEELSAFQSGWTEWTDDTFMRSLPYLPLRLKFEAAWRTHDRRRPKPGDFVPHYLLRMARTARRRVVGTGG